MFKLMGKEINTILGAQTILIWTFDSDCIPVRIFQNVDFEKNQQTTKKSMKSYPVGKELRDTCFFSESIYD